MTDDAVLPETPAGPPARGVFISFEGGDGVGKSTQIRLLADWLTAQGREVVATREPGGTTLGLELRAAVLHGDHVSARTEALLYATDRSHHVATVVRPALARGAVVLTDRYLDSSVAYQGDGRALGAQEVERLSLWATEGLLPRLTVLLDLDPTVGLARLTASPDRLERAGAEFHARTRRAFLERAAGDPVRWLVVDASRSVEEIAAQVRARVEALLARTDAADAVADLVVEPAPAPAAHPTGASR
ncbi:dTMP kinase [Actinotalea sp.]|uniref:dTMP kinase n=1 Tax=Actinotalea sp. TaxID=1872145 RepID=UPI002CF4DFE4|nr:dTMP kinase [Actinotalea sp.]HQY33533.1 dTMP kinase [Actinotalea sp.]HRA49647.1 dTMP kinase [Actinotalea sp.]